MLVLSAEEQSGAAPTSDAKGRLLLKCVESALGKGHRQTKVCNGLAGLNTAARWPFSARTTTLTCHL
jgi:hypothetical protein